MSRWLPRISLPTVRGRCAAVSLGRDAALFYAADTGEIDVFNRYGHDSIAACDAVQFAPEQCDVERLCTNVAVIAGQHMALYCTTWRYRQTATGLNTDAASKLCKCIAASVSLGSSCLSVALRVYNSGACAVCTARYYCKKVDSLQCSEADAKCVFIRTELLRPLDAYTCAASVSRSRMRHCVAATCSDCHDADTMHKLPVPCLVSNMVDHTGRLIH
eukprot:16042-Heterococcus_DN1.PRE.1